MVSTAFVCGNKGLEVRVNRLLELDRATPRDPVQENSRLSAALALTAVLIAGAAATAALTPWLHDLSEHLLHLG